MGDYIGYLEEHYKLDSSHKHGIDNEENRVVCSRQVTIPEEWLWRRASLESYV